MEIGDWVIVDAYPGFAFWKGLYGQMYGNATAISDEFILVEFRNLGNAWVEYINPRFLVKLIPSKY